MGRHSAEPDTPPSTRPRPTPYGHGPFSLEELKARLEAELAEFEARPRQRPRPTSVAVMEHTADLTAEMSRLFDTDVLPALRFDVEPPLTDAGPHVRRGSDWLPSRLPSTDPINPSGPDGPGHRPGRGSDADYNRPHPYPVTRPKPTPRPTPKAEPVAAEPVAAEPVVGEPLVVHRAETPEIAPTAFRNGQPPPSRAGRARHRAATSPRRPIVVRTPVLVAAALAAAVVSADQLDVLHTTPDSAAATSDGVEQQPTASLAAATPGLGQRVSRSSRRLSLGDDYVAEAVAPKTAPARKVAKPKPTSTMKPGQTVAGKWVRPNNGPYNSCFCERWGTFHEGIDFAGNLGTPIYAVGDGVVLEAGPAAGFGNWVVIQHANGDVTIYGHMRYYYVQAGQRVKAGQEIAVVGEEGDVTGPHLHFGVRVGGIDGPYTDPVPWLKARGVSVGPYEPGM